ncbi:MAG: DUF721 domain-containing protein [Chlamydiae bacterium]|nr:DUF721 domain-containing protein [Chlamydiota bacterium]
MAKFFSRTPKYYDGTAKTTKELSQILPDALRKLGANFEQRPDLILAIWPELIGEKLAPMTQAVSFVEGILTVKVRNSSLYSLLSQHEKPKLVKALRSRFPSVIIRNINFRLG